MATRLCIHDMRLGPINLLITLCRKCPNICDNRESHVFAVGPVSQKLVAYLSLYATLFATTGE